MPNNHALNDDYQIPKLIANYVKGAQIKNYEVQIINAAVTASRYLLQTLTISTILYCSMQTKFGGFFVF